MKKPDWLSSAGTILIALLFSRETILFSRTSAESLVATDIRIETGMLCGKCKPLTF